jgi:threonine dehydrogenase-like Zn-dependent dehydrogenase
VPALTVLSPGDLRLIDGQPPHPDADTHVTPTLVGVCGTDLDIIDGRIDADFVRYPVVLGHEWAGRLDDGQRVVVEGIVPCGTCAECRGGQTNVCASYDELGFTRSGAATDSLMVPGNLVHVLADGVSDADGVLVEPAAVVLRALTRTPPRPGERILVIGDGTVALLATMIAALSSPAELVVAGRRDAQRDLAEQSGATRFTTGDPGAGFDVVIEAAGAAEATRAAISAARRGGRLILLGFPGAGVEVGVEIDQVVNFDLTVAGSFSYTSAAWRQTVELINAGLLRPGFLVTHRVPLADFPRAIDLLRGGAGPRAKVALEI